MTTIASELNLTDQLLDELDEFLGEDPEEPEKKKFDAKEILQNFKLIHSVGPMVGCFIEIDKIQKSIIKKKYPSEME